MYFRFKMNNTRALRALFGKRQATVLEDYLRLDREITLSDLDARLPELLANVLQEAAWSLGLRTESNEIKDLIKHTLGEAK